MLNTLPPNAAVLDLGCGSGDLRAALRIDCRYTGVDVSAVAIGTARTRWPSEEFTRADLEEWRGDRHWDLVVCNEVLYYLNDPATVLQRFVRLVQPGGLFAVSIYLRQTQFWQQNPNRTAYGATKAFFKHIIDAHEVSVSEHGGRWALFFGHPR